MSNAVPRIAIACSGLGHVSRGIEAWAVELAGGLRAAGQDVTLFSGRPTGEAVALPCVPRGSAAARRVTSLFSALGGWRFGLGAPYEVEQSAFAFSLWLRLRTGFDIVHLQDPLVALWLERAWRLRLSPARVIYANGTGEPGRVMRRFGHLQHLTEQAATAWRPNQPPGQQVFSIPIPIDTARFTPGDRAAARARLGWAADQIVILCCAAIRRFHKRIDVLIEEAASILPALAGKAVLVIAGGREADTDALIAEGSARLGSSVRFLVDVDRADIPTLYQAADIFVLPSLYEMFGVVLLEAMASSLPIICNDSDSFRAIVGPAGQFAALDRPGALAAATTAMLDADRRSALAAAARAHVIAQYGRDAVTPQVIDMYRAVLATGPAGAPARHLEARA